MRAYQPLQESNCVCNGPLETSDTLEWYGLWRKGVDFASGWGTQSSSRQAGKRVQQALVQARSLTVREKEGTMMPETQTTAPDAHAEQPDSAGGYFRRLSVRAWLLRAKLLGR